MVRVTTFSILGVSLFNVWLYESNSRQPAQEQKQIELHIKTMFVDDGGAPKRVEGKYFIKATFADSYEFEFGKNDNLVIQRGTAQNFDYKVDVNNAWVKSGQLPFKLEVISKETFEKTLVKCEQMPQEIQNYNRTFQCFLPLQRQSFLTYRLGDKNVKPEEPTKMVQVR